MDNEKYFEVVISHTRLEGVVRVLESVFGTPAWPSGKKLSKDTEKLIKEAGGLRKGQTLYFLTKEEYSAFVMLWPWQDGERITIKMSKVKGE
jgi:hypothetical protein